LQQFLSQREHPIEVEAVWGPRIGEHRHAVLAASQNVVFAKELLNYSPRVVKLIPGHGCDDDKVVEAEVPAGRVGQPAMGDYAAVHAHAEVQNYRLGHLFPLHPSETRLGSYEDPSRGFCSLFPIEDL
jgi:hypothetical protein